MNATTSPATLHGSEPTGTTVRKVLMILGVLIDDLTLDGALDRIGELVESGRATGRHHQVVTVNVDFALNAMVDPELRGILREADMATADGMPLVWGARLLGVPLEDRVTGADLVPALAQRAAEKGYSLYFLGAAPGVAQRAAEILQQRHPGLKIAGVDSPPYSSVLDMGDDVVQRIRAARPDILLVAFGNPKQEKWIAMHGPELGVPVSIGVGGTFDFITGVTRRAPHWMQQAGLEWSYRLLQEPRRLWKRYLSNIAGFSFFFLRQWWAMRGGRQAAAVSPAEDVLMVSNQAVVTLRGRIDSSNLAEAISSIEEALQVSRYVVLNLADVSFLDSSAIGSLMALTKRARDDGGDLALVHVPSSVLRVFRLLRLDLFFEIHRDLAQVLAERPAGKLIQFRADPPEEDWGILQVPRRLDAATAPELSAKGLELLSSTPKLLLDFSNTAFLSSAGLAVMLRLTRKAAQRGGEVRIAGCSPDVRRVIRLAKLDRVLSICPDKCTSNCPSPYLVRAATAASSACAHPRVSSSRT